MNNVIVSLEYFQASSTLAVPGEGNILPGEFSCPPVQDSLTAQMGLENGFLCI